MEHAKFSYDNYKEWLVYESVIGNDIYVPLITRDDETFEMVDYHIMTDANDIKNYADVIYRSHDITQLLSNLTIEWKKPHGTN